jgi:hypothetical protein
VKKTCALAALVVLTAALLAASTNAAFDLRTWTTTSAAPADGSPTAGSASFVVFPRVGGSFVGHSESASFMLWGCGTTPVEGSFFATETEPLNVTIRWVVSSLNQVEEFNLYRATSEEGPFERVNDPGEIPAETPGHYVDTTVWPGTTFWYELRAVMTYGVEEVVGGSLASVTTGGTLVTRLYPAAPNPFGSSTVIQLDIASVRGGVRLTVYDIAGRVVKTFEPGVERPGRYTVTWDGTNDNGQRIASGVYFCSMEVNGARETGRIVYLR